VALLLAAVVAGRADAYATGPEDARAGDPPERETCAMATCHTEFPVGSGDGALSLTGVPSVYEPGTPYEISVLLADPGQERWGFELTVLRSDFLQAGEIALLSPQETQLSIGDGPAPDYLKQTLDGTFDEQADGPVSWSFLWTPAAGDQTVTFYVAGNAADGNDEPVGDYVYTLEVSCEETGKPATEEKSWSLIKSLYLPRPTRDRRLTTTTEGRSPSALPVAARRALVR